MSRHVQADGNSTARVFAPAARAAPPTPSFTGEKTLSAFPFPQQLAEGAGAFPGKPQRLRPGVASPDCMVGSGLDYAAASTVLYGPAVFDSAVLGVGRHMAGSARHPGRHLPQIRRVFDLPGVTAAAHAVSCRARGARFCELLRADRAALGVAPVPVSGHAETRRSRPYWRRVTRVAGHPLDCLARYGRICLRHARAVPRPTVRPVKPAPLQVPRILGGAPYWRPCNGPSSDFKTTAGTAETRPSLSPLGMPSRSRTKLAILSIHSTQLRPSAYLVQSTSGPLPLPEGLFLLRDRLGLLIFDFLFLLLMLAIRIGDPHAFQLARGSVRRHRWEFSFLDKAPPSPSPPPARPPESP